MARRPRLKVTDFISRRLLPKDLEEMKLMYVVIISHKAIRRFSLPLLCTGTTSGFPLGTRSSSSFSRHLFTVDCNQKCSSILARIPLQRWLSGDKARWCDTHPFGRVLHTRTQTSAHHSTTEPCASAPFLPGAHPSRFSVTPKTAISYHLVKNEPMLT